MSREDGIWAFQQPDLPTEKFTPERQPVRCPACMFGNHADHAAMYERERERTVVPTLPADQVERIAAEAAKITTGLIIKRLDAVLRLVQPDHLTPMGARQIKAAVMAGLTTTQGD